MKWDPRWAEWPTEHKTEGCMTDAERLYAMWETSKPKGLKHLAKELLPSLKVPSDVPDQS